MIKLTMKRNRLWSLLLVGFLLFLLVPSVHAVEIFDEGTVVIGADEVIEDDLMVFANEFTLEGTVKGDLITFANKATILGTVEGDLMGAGQEIKVGGTIGDDVRLAGMSIAFHHDAVVKDDVMVAGYSLETLPGSEFEGDFYFAGGQSRLAGDIAGDLSVNAGGLELLGNVAGNVDAEVGDALQAPVISPFEFVPGVAEVPTFAWGLTVDEQAQIDGDLAYASTVAVEIPANVVGGDVSFEEVVVPQAEQEEVSSTNTAVNWLARELREFVVLLLIGLLMVWLMPFWSRKVSDFVQNKPLPSLGWGLITLAAFAIAFGVIFALTVLLAAFFGFITLSSLSGATITIGLVLMFALVVVFVLTVMFLTKIFVSMALGRFLLGRFSSDAEVNRYWALLLGLFLVVLFTAIPWVGPILSLFVMLFGLGALWQEGFKGWQYRLDWRSKEKEPEVEMKPA